MKLLNTKIRIEVSIEVIVFLQHFPGEDRTFERHILNNRSLIKYKACLALNE